MSQKNCRSCHDTFESTLTGRVYLDVKTEDGFKRVWFCPGCSPPVVKKVHSEVNNGG